MAIFSQCCDVRTRALVWCPRKPGTDAPYQDGTPSGDTAASIAGSHSAAFAADVRPIVWVD